MGKKIARIPNTQMRLKIEPTNGFRQGKSSWAIGGFNAIINITNNPRREIPVVNIGMGL